MGVGEGGQCEVVGGEEEGVGVGAGVSVFIGGGRANGEIQNSEEREHEAQPISCCNAERVLIREAGMLSHQLVSD